MLTIEYHTIIKFVHNNAYNWVFYYYKIFHNNANNWVSYYYKICP
jgi:hypothetical protein